jgi:DNA modification methylase
VLDPFAGVGITGTAAAKRGLRFFGIEAHPLAAELARLKLTAPQRQPSILLKAAEEITERARSMTSAIDSTIVSQEADLVRRSFTNRNLSELVALRESLSMAGPEQLWLKWALLATLRDVASVSVGWPYQRPGKRRQPLVGNVFARFNQRVAWMVDDLSEISLERLNSYGSLEAGGSSSLSAETHQVINGDSRLPQSWLLQDGSAAACVSSPPYLNNFDYADATRLELYFLSYVTTWGDMCRKVRHGMLIATTQQTKLALAEEAWDSLTSYPAVYGKLREIESQLRARRAERPRGKEYDRVLPCYFAGMALVLSQLSKALAIGAKCYWVIGDSAPYGVYVNTPEIIGELAQEFGLQTMKDLKVRKRGGRWANNGTRHQVPLAERLLIAVRTSPGR